LFQNRVLIYINWHTEATHVQGLFVHPQCHHIALPTAELAEWLQAAEDEAT
jgi:hypothetical protein